MPADRTLAEGLALAIVELYTDLQERMARDIARRLAADPLAPLPAWVAAKHAGVHQLRRAGERMLAALDADLTGRVEQAITLAYARGGDAAVDELAKLGRLTAADRAMLREGLPNAAVLQRMIWTLVSTLRGTHLRVLRWEQDAYREVVARTSLTGVATGGETRLRTAQRAWEQLLGRGITGFTDKAGRNWQLASYVEMATRTGVAQAAVEGHLDRLADLGVDLVIVSNAPQECARCRPWESKILSRGGGGARTVEVEHATRDGETVRVEVAGSVGEAVAAGLMHPNCRRPDTASPPTCPASPARLRTPPTPKATRHGSTSAPWNAACARPSSRRRPPSTRPLVPR